MWNCSKCLESSDDALVVCWKCGTSRDGVEAPTLRSQASPDDVRAAARLRQAERPDGGADPIWCPRCDQKLEYTGTKRFHEGTNWGVLGELGELFVKRERLDVYVCPRCGRLEFFVDGIGERFRPH